MKELKLLSKDVADSMAQIKARVPSYPDYAAKYAAVIALSGIQGRVEIAEEDGNTITLEPRVPATPEAVLNRLNKKAFPIETDGARYTSKGGVVYVQKQAGNLSRALWTKPSPMENLPGERVKVEIV